MTYNETVNYLYQQLPAYQRIGKAAYKADLETTILLDNYFGNPHKHFKTIHVGGTNGKGSTSHMLASVLQSAGYKVGLHTSPHLIDFRERIKINGEMISEQSVIEFVAKHKKMMEELKPSFFELTVAMAFDYFAAQSVDIAIIEVGMGGRLDSTNIINPLLSVITNIGLDHTEFLGDTIAKIAQEKAGIIKPNVPVVIGEWDSESARVFVEKAQQMNAPIVFADRMLHIDKVKQKGDKQRFKISANNSTLFNYYTVDLDIDLLGTYQSQNIVTVLTAIELLRQSCDIKINNTALINGLANTAQQTGLQGRWQILQQNPLVVCDTGHNEHGLQHVTNQLKQLAYKKLHIVFGVVNDKNISNILPLLPKNAHYYFTQANIPRALNANLLAEQCASAGLKGDVIPNVTEALQKAKINADVNDVIFVGGSTFVVAEVL